MKLLCHRLDTDIWFIEQLFHLAYTGIQKGSPVHTNHRQSPGQMISRVKPRTHNLNLINYRVWTKRLTCPFTSEPSPLRQLRKRMAWSLERKQMSVLVQLGSLNKLCAQGSPVQILRSGTRPLSRI
ncbi:unnamed protein product [Ixodes pacificus]